MTILTKDEIDTCALDGCRDDYAFAEEVEKAVLEKLAGMELPEPLAGEQAVFEDWLHDCAPSGDAESVQAQWLASYEYREFLELQEFTAAQLHQAFAQGAASQLSCGPVSGESQFDGYPWAPCSVEHVRMVLENPGEWIGYEARYLYTLKAPK